MLTCLGAAYGTAKAGVGVCSMGVMRPDMVMKSIIPCIMAGIIGIYGLIIAILISQNISDTSYTPFQGFAALGAGLCTGFGGLGKCDCLAFTLTTH